MASNSIREPGRFRQLFQLYKMTIKADRKALPIALGGAVGTMVVLLVFGIWSSGGNIFAIIAWIVASLLTGFLLAMILMSRRAERVAYSNIEGRPGAVGAIIENILRRGWSGAQMPVAVNPRGGEAVYRLSGPGGVVLIAEGQRSVVSRLIEAEKAKLHKAVSGVPIQVIWVCGDEHSTALADIRKVLYKFPKALNRSELSQVNKRLSTLRLNLPIPKGIDPTRMPKGARR